MDLADLAGPSVIRRVAVMLVAGAALLPVRAALRGAPAEAPLVVAVDDPADVPDAVLVDQGLRAGWVRTDPVIRQRLVADLRFTGAEGSDDALLALAAELGLPAADPVVRQRLIARAGDVLAATAAPTDAELAAHLAAHPDRFARPARIRLDQVFVGDGDADAALAAIHRGDDVAGAPLSPLPSTWTGTVPELDARLGPGFADAARGDAWHVARSAYGAHVVRGVVEPPVVPPLHEIRAAVTASWRHDAREEAVRAGTASLVARYAVTLR